MTDTVVEGRASRNLRVRGLRAGIGFVDQAISSVTNFIGTIVAARGLSAGALGRFTLIGTVYLVVLVISRGIVSEPIVLNHSAAPDAAHQELRRAAGVMLLLSLTASVAIGLVGGLLLVGDLRTCALVLACLLPTLLYQDLLRFVALTVRRPGIALAMDGGWFVGQIGFAIIAYRAHATWSPSLAALAWLGPGAASVILGIATLKLAPHMRGSVRWLSQNAALGFRLGASNLLQQIGMLLVFLLALVASPVQVAYFRVAQTVMGPVAHPLNQGFRFASLPELVRLRDSNMRAFQRSITWSAGAVSTSLIVWGVIMLMLPARIGSALFGASWAGARPLIALTTIAVAAGGICFVHACGVRACADAKGSLRTTAQTAVLYLVFGSIGGAFNGAMGTSLALAICSPVSAALWSLRLRASRWPYEVAALQGASR